MNGTRILSDPGPAAPIASGNDGPASVAMTGVSIERSGVRIVCDATLRVATGSVVGLVGPNGSGKTTLLKSVYRSLRPSSGSITVDGDDVWRELGPKSLARRLALVGQDQSTEFDYTVVEVVQTGRLPHQGLLSHERAEDRRVVDAALERVGVTHLRNRVYSTLSGGERQRVLVARALAQQTSILILDEFTNHLDIRAQLELLALTRSLGVTVLTAIHDLNLASTYCDALVVLCGGRVVAFGPPADVLTPSLVRDVFGVRMRVLRDPEVARPVLSFEPLPSTSSSGRCPTGRSNQFQE